MPVVSPTDQPSDEQSERIRDLLPPDGQRGGQWGDHRLTIDGILRVLADGGRWRNRPGRYGPLAVGLRPLPQLGAPGPVGRDPAPPPGPPDDRRPDRRVAVPHRRHGDPRPPVGGRCPEKKGPAGEPADRARGRSQGGFGTKRSPICDGEGRPIAVAVAPGQQHETRQAIPLLEGATARPGQPAKVAGGKGYSAGWLREWPRERGIEPVIAHREGEEARAGRFDKKAYRRRTVIEPCVNSLKRVRRVATRYEKRATPYRAMVTLAMIFRLLG